MTTYNFTILDNTLWVLGFVGHLVLIVILIVTKCAKQFPVFASRIAYQVGGSVLLYLISTHGSKDAYFRAYWLFAGGDYLLQIGIIIELARNVLRPTGTWIEDAGRQFLGWSILGFVVAVVCGLAITPPDHTGLDLWSIRSVIFTSILTCEVFMAMAVVAHRLGLHWSSHVMAIGEGLTIWAVICLFAETARFASGWSPLKAFNYVEQIVYVASLLFWIVAFLRPEPIREPLSAEMQKYLEHLHQAVQNDLNRIG